MATVAQKSFYAQLHGASGLLGQLDGQVTFFAFDGPITAIASYAGLTVLGEAAVADTQQVMDRLHGGAAQIACSRDEGVQ